MNIKKILISAFFALAFTPTASVAIDFQSRVVTSELLGISSTGKSIILDRGSLEGLKVGTKARLLEQKGTMEKPILKFVAYAEAVKVQDKISFWILRDVSPNALPRPGARLAFLTEEGSFEAGKAPVKILNRKVIMVEGKDISEYNEDVKRGVPDKIVYQEQDYDNEELAVTNPITKDHHIETTNFDSWFDKQGLRYVEDYMAELETKFVSSESNLPNNQRVREQNSYNGFEAQTIGVIEKTNKLKEGLRGLYAEANRDIKMKGMREITLIENTFDSHYEQKRRENNKGISDSAKAKMKKDGDMWSADFNDKELRNFVVANGIEREKNRQRLSLEELVQHELIISYAASLSDYTSTEDPNHQGKNYALSIGYEYHVSKLNQNLKKWSFDIFLERQLARYEIAPEINGRFEDTSLKVGVNYYLIGNPDLLNQFAWYLGLGLKRGSSKMESFFIMDSYDYEISAMPVASLGLKYRFRAGDDVSDIVRMGFGLNLKLSYEALKYSITNNEIGQNVDGSVQVNDTKFSIGMSVYF